jgi:hypothetical protein
VLQPPAGPVLVADHAMAAAQRAARARTCIWAEVVKVLEEGGPLLCGPGSGIQLPHTLLSFRVSLAAAGGAHPLAA